MATPPTPSRPAAAPKVDSLNVGKGASVHLPVLAKPACHRTVHRVSTLTRKPTARKPGPRSAGVKKVSLEKEILSLVGTLVPPAAKGTTGDLLRAVESGEWGKDVDWAKVELAYRSRSTSRLLRAS